MAGGTPMSERRRSTDSWLVRWADLEDLTLVDLPTGHWPMLSRPADLADIIAAEADRS